MKNDIDFDELDRAVNSLITSKPIVGSNNAPKERVLEIGSKSSTSPISPTIPNISYAKPINSTPATPTNPAPVAPTAVAPAPSVPTTLVARRSSGQFMDVVHPSSNMSGQRATPLIMPDRISRQGIATKQPMPNTTVAPSTVDMALQSIAPTPVVTTPPTPAVSVEPKPIQNDNSSGTPFVANANVEKRPLGAFSDAKIDEKPETDLSSEVGSKSIGTAKKSNEEPLPAELQNDLLLIESGDALPENEKNLSAVDNDIEFAKIDSSQATTTATTPAPATSSQPVATSIKPQYEEKPSTGDKTSGAVFDTEKYHNGLVAPVKKKSGWMWVIWIVLLLVVGAGAGAAIYFFAMK